MTVPRNRQFNHPVVDSLGGTYQAPGLPQMLCPPEIKDEPERIRNHVKAFAGRWAGERLIMIGKDSSAGELPVSVLSNRGTEVDLYDRVQKYYVDLYQVEDQFVSRFGQSSALQENDNPNQPACDWVLCNLDQKEYVRLDDIPAALADRKCFGLGHVLILLICWTDSKKRYDASLGRGRWAGNRIAVEAAIPQPGPDGKPWKDISEEAFAKVKTFWDVKYRQRTRTGLRSDGPVE
ncbi:hypothetical protein BKA93DRAFT_502216 [Sparassis latifolia]